MRAKNGRRRSKKISPSLKRWISRRCRKRLPKRWKPSIQATRHSPNSMPPRPGARRPPKRRQQRRRRLPRPLCNRKTSNPIRQTRESRAGTPKNAPRPTTWRAGWRQRNWGVGFTPSMKVAPKPPARPSAPAPAPDRGAAAGATPADLNREEDRDERRRRAEPKRPAASKRGEPRRRTGRLTITQALEIGDAGMERKRSEAAARRRREKESSAPRRVRSNIASRVAK